jgi:phosphate/sulfate permease
MSLKTAAIAFSLLGAYLAGGSVSETESSTIRSQCVHP